MLILIATNRGNKGVDFFYPISTPTSDIILFKCYYTKIEFWLNSPKIGHYKTKSRKAILCNFVLFSIPLSRPHRFQSKQTSKHLLAKTIRRYLHSKALDFLQ
jgi:hypothetical protein